MEDKFMFPEHKRVFISSVMKDSHGFDQRKMRKDIFHKLTQAGCEVWRHEDLPSSHIKMPNAYLCPIRFCDIVLFIIDVEDEISEAILQEYFYARQLHKVCLFVVRGDKRPVKLHPTKLMKRENLVEVKKGVLLQETIGHYNNRLNFINEISSSNSCNIRIIKHRTDIVSEAVEAVKNVWFDSDLHEELPCEWTEYPHRISPVQIQEIGDKLSKSATPLPINLHLSSYINKNVKNKPCDSDFYSIVLNCCDDKTFEMLRSSEAEKARETIIKRCRELCYDSTGKTENSILSYLNALLTHQKAK